MPDPSLILGPACFLYATRIDAYKCFSFLFILADRKRDPVLKNEPQASFEKNSTRKYTPAVFYLQEKFLRFRKICEGI